jgi:hypothetical protein
VTLFVNINPEGQGYRIVNVDHILEISLWQLPDGGVGGTMLRMNCQDGRTDGFGPMKITVATPFADIIRRMRQGETLYVGPPAPPPQLTMPPVAT